MIIDASKPVNRLGIFFFYDSDGIADDYVFTLLDGLMPHFSDLVVVVNGKLDPESRRKLGEYTARIIVRPNKGYDVWAYKTAMEKYGWDNLRTFDEIVLFNATIMGPVHPFSEMFETMDARDLDFWGITKYNRIPHDPYGYSLEEYLPEHIQSHFHVYRRSLVSSPQFREYWEEMPMIRNYMQAVGLHEARFTEHFANLGFKWDVYVKTDDMKDLTFGPIMMEPKELVAHRGCPIFKRRSFFDPYSDMIDQSVGNATLDLYEYLRDHTDFDTDLIWQNALRTMNLDDLVREMHLYRVLSQTDAAPIEKPHKIALVMHLYFMDLLDESIHYMRSMPEGCDIILTVGSEEKQRIVRERTKDLPYNIDVRLVQNRGRDVSALLVGAGKDLMKYDLVCFAHDKKVTQLFPESIGEGFAIKMHENVLATPAYVRNVIHLFESEPRLGMAMPTPPNHADYFPGYSFGWGPNYPGTAKLLYRLGFPKVPMNVNKNVVAPLGTMFWFRPAALKGLVDREWKYEDFPPEPNKADGTLLHFIERAYCYVAQANGYVSSYIFSDRFARIEITNLSYGMEQLTRAISDPWIEPTLTQTVHSVVQGKSARASMRRAIKTRIKRIPWLKKIALGIRHALGKDPVNYSHQRPQDSERREKSEDDAETMRRAKRQAMRKAEKEADKKRKTGSYVGDEGDWTDVYTV